ALGLEDDLRGAQVRGLGQREPGVEAADLADLRRALGDRVAGRVHHLIRDGGHRTGDPADVAVLALIDRAQPALERDLLAGLVHLAIVGDVPREGLFAGLPEPAAAFVPEPGVLGDERDVVALARDQEVRALVRRGAQRQRRHAAVVGRPRDAVR